MPDLAPIVCRRVLLLQYRQGTVATGCMICFFFASHGTVFVSVLSKYFMYGKFESECFDIIIYLKPFPFKSSWSKTSLMAIASTRENSFFIAFL